MASITTILGTDSVSSSRIVLNNNFAALNDELADIANLLNTTTQVLTLTGLITGGTLKIKNTSNVETFKVNDATAEVNVPTTFNQDVVLGNSLTHSITYVTPTLPTTYNYTTYILDAGELAGVNTLAAADDGQEITLIADGSGIIINNGNLVGPAADVVMGNGGTLTLRFSEHLGGFAIISSYKCGL